MENRKIKFFKLNAKCQDDSFKSNREIKDFITNIFENASLTDDGYKYEIFTVNKIKYTFEFITLNDDETFLRVRQPRPKNHYGKSEDENVTLRNLDIDSNEHMESFTFIYIDFKTCIVSYLKISGTPPITIFTRFLVEQNGYGNGVTYSCDAIATKEIINQIVKKKKLGTISYSFCNPEEDVLSDITGMTDTIIDNMAINKSTIEVKLSPARMKNLLNDNKILFAIKKTLELKFGLNLKKLSISAGDYEDSKMVVFNLLNQEFTQETNIKTDEDLTIENYLKEIRSAYKMVESDIVQYIKNS